MTADKPLPLVPKLRFPEFEDAPEWQEERLGNLIAIVSGKSPSQYVLFAQGDCAFVKVEDLNNCSKYQVDAREYCNDVRDAVPSGSILFPKRGAAIENNKIRITASEILIDTNLMALTPCNAAATEFLYYYLARVGLAQIADTSSIPQINNKHIIPYRVLVPSESEQAKIADCLESLDELIAAEGRKLEALWQHKQGLMQQLFPQPGETVPRLRFPEFANHSAWKPSKLEAIGQLSSGTTPARANPEFFDGGNIPWVKTKDLNNSLIDATEEHITARANARINPPGSILIAMYGGYRQIGRTGLLKIPAATNQAISVLVVDQGATLPVFVLAWLNARVGDWKRIASSSRKDPNITGADVASFPIRLPSIPEQRRTAACLAALDDHICAQDRKLYTLNQHKRGMLQQLFPSLKRRPK